MCRRLSAELMLPDVGPPGARASMGCELPRALRLIYWFERKETQEVRRYETNRRLPRDAQVLPRKESSGPASR
jgi:hypothetical protein